MRASESALESCTSKRLLYFANLICSWVSGLKALDKGIAVFPYSIAVKLNIFNIQLRGNSSQRRTFQNKFGKDLLTALHI